jgi:drug/metabolite transporter (DMT)-like permease
MMWLMWALCSAVLSAAAAVIQKKILFRITALEFSFGVSALILLVSMVAPFVVDVTSLPPSTLLIIIGKSMLGAFAFLLVMLSLKNNQISSALPLLGLTPAVAALLSVPALGESLGLWEWTAIGLMMVGTYLIEKRSSQKIFEPLKLALMSKSHYPIVGALLLFAVSAVADKRLVSGFKVHPLTVLFYQHIVYCVVFGIGLALSRLVNRPPDNQPGPRVPILRELVQTYKQHVPLIAAVALITGAYRFAQLEATTLAPAALVLAVKRTSIIFASLYGGTLFHDERLRMKLVGALLITGSGFLILRFIV